MRKLTAVVIGGLLVVGGLGGIRQAAQAHVCDDPQNQATCEDTPVMPNWRDNYVPLFDLENRNDEQQRYDAQRWRDECDNQQQCVWAETGTSLFETGSLLDGDPPEGLGSPNEAHIGMAASHCFLAEAAHQCEDHDPASGEGVHDAHGGAVYADACLTQNSDPATNKWCNDGMTDTQVGVTIMDHNPCGTLIPIVACTDEYHVIRPFDQPYTDAQKADSQAALAAIVADPATYICGHHDSGQDCRDGVNTLLDFLF